MVWEIVQSTINFENVAAPVYCSSFVKEHTSIQCLVVSANCLLLESRMSVCSVFIAYVVVYFLAQQCS